MNDINPIFIIGTHCSGKSLLANCLNLIDGLYWWEEPNTILRMGNLNAKHDRREPVKMNSTVAIRIRNSYAKKQKKLVCDRIVDDSPFHCINLPFIRSIFPDSKIIHIFRDPRDVIFDTLKQWREPLYPLTASTLHFIVKRLKETSVHEWIPYFIRTCHVFREKLFSKVIPERRYGVLYPGMRQDVLLLTIEELACRQWQICQQYALDDLSALPQTAYHSFSYESFVNAPLETFHSIVEFMGLTINEKTSEFLSNQINRDYIGIGSDMFSKENGHHLQSLLEPTLSYIDTFLR